MLSQWCAHAPSLARVWPIKVHKAWKYDIKNQWILKKRWQLPITFLELQKLSSLHSSRQQCIPSQSSRQPVFCYLGYKEHVYYHSKFLDLQHEQALLSSSWFCWEDDWKYFMYTQTLLTLCRFPVQKNNALLTVREELHGEIYKSKLFNMGQTPTSLKSLL